MIVLSSTMQGESSRQLTPDHSIVSNNSDADGRILSEREPFLTFDPNSQLAFEDKSRIYNSLVALVKAEYPFDNVLQDRAARFLKSLEPTVYKHEIADKLVTDLVPSSVGSPSGFVESFATLLSSPHSTLVAAALSFLHEAIPRSSTENGHRLVESDLLVKVFAILRPHTLPISENETILNYLSRIIDYFANLGSPPALLNLRITSPVDTYNHREMIFQKVVLPSSQFLTFLLTNRSMLNGDLLESFMSLLATLIRLGPFHRPTLEFVLASPIAMELADYLSYFEESHRVWVPLLTINFLLKEWKEEGPQVAQSGKQKMQALISEGFEDTLEQTMKHDKSEYYGSSIVRDCSSISKSLGSNVPRR
ncbi:hypothetical protein BLNAU_4982 [Blattamonas nauphoetae]|uniref:Uncharacterized protein n=1 Tax=Blattamonas nauphoetae TaxID=2049346 RepID=A0ABQ9Y8S0_9EUKA|nr:hypothetical protein BLNAU_4982 [Blattamonas nauphoetae]